MKSPKLFTCQQCDAELEIENPQDRARVVCRRCGGLHDLRFTEAEQAWTLRLREPVEPGTEVRKEEPFSVLGEVGRPKRVDRSEKHREQTDLHADEEIAVSKPEKKP